MYSLLHFSNVIWAYILRLIQQFKKPVVDEKVEVETYVGIAINKALRKVTAYDFQSIYSSDKSINRGPVYGGDIKQYRNFVSDLAVALLTDAPFDVENLLKNRAELFVRDIFIDVTGETLDHIAFGFELKEQAVRLADALALRVLHPELGSHTLNNCSTARYVLKDLDVFFKESCDGYHSYRTGGGSSIHFWESR